MNCICCCSKTIETPIKDDFVGNKLMICTNCNHVQLYKIPTPEEIINYYEGDYSLHRSRFDWDSYLLTMTKRAVAQSKYLNKYIKLNKNTTILDNGCGYGMLVDELGKISDHVSGLEFDPKCVEYCHEHGLNVKKISDEKEMESIEKHHLICMSHVLEHLTSVEETMKILKERGEYIFIEIPYYDISFKDQWSDQQGHINFFNEKSISLLFQRLGFEIIDISRVGPSLAFQWSRSYKYIRGIIRRLLFFKTLDTYYGMYSKKNKKGTWLRCIIKCN